MNILTTYNEIFLFNAVFMGFEVRLWMQEVLSWFGRIVADVSNSTRLEQECNVLTVRISKVAAAQIKLSKYKSYMLASLRSPLAEEWSSAHKVAWSWLWDNVECHMAVKLGKPPALLGCTPRAGA